MIQPHTFAIHVTYTCPLACAHCCFSSSPENRDRLPVEHLFGAIDALKTEEIGLVAFTGGEPFLLGPRLVEAVARAHGRGLRTRIVTSAYFGKHAPTARKRMEEVRAAGLDELTISWDDFHEVFVAFEAVATVFRLAKELGIDVGVNVVQARDSRWTAARVREQLGLLPDSPECIGETPLNLTGRAETDLADAGLRPERYLGPCPYVLTGPTLSARSKLLACCGVIPNTNALTIDADFKPENLNAALERAARSPLLNWLYLRGPYAIMEFISARFGAALPRREAIGGNCEACKLLFETPGMARHLDAAVALKAEELEGELSVLGALGWLTPEKLQYLWQDKAVVLDRPPA